MLFFLLIIGKMPTICWYFNIYEKEKTVGILTFVSRKTFMLSWVEHDFYNLGSDWRYLL